MRSTTNWRVCLAVGLLLSIAAPVPADQHEHDDLPAGPIRDRHALMEGIGEQAETINDAIKAGATGGQVAAIENAANALAADARKIPGRFPKGSTDPKSRALPVIWEHWSTFEKGAAELDTQASALAVAAASGDTKNLKAKARQVFSVCKSCHDQFRKPEE